MDLESTLAEIAPNLLRYCVGVSGDPAEGEEVAQEALTALVAEWRKNGPPRSCKAFVYTVAKRVAWRVRWRKRFLAPLGVVVDGHEPDPEEAFSRRRELEEALAAMKCLPGRDREALLLASAGELGVKEAAGVLGISISAFKMRVHRARQRLKQYLENGHEKQ